MQAASRRFPPSWWSASCPSLTHRWCAPPRPWWIALLHLPIRSAHVSTKILRCASSYQCCCRCQDVDDVMKGLEAAEIALMLMISPSQLLIGEQLVACLVWKWSQPSTGLHSDVPPGGTHPVPSGHQPRALVQSTETATGTPVHIAGPFTQPLYRRLSLPMRGSKPKNRKLIQPLRRYTSRRCVLSVQCRAARIIIKPQSWAKRAKQLGFLSLRLMSVFER